jgi:hypothetical protein
MRRLPLLALQALAAIAHAHTHTHTRTRGAWDADEDDTLRSMQAAHGNAWARIGAELGRHPEAVKDRWANIGNANKAVGACRRGGRAAASCVCGGRRTKRLARGPLRLLCCVVRCGCAGVCGVLWCALCPPPTAAAAAATTPPPHGARPLERGGARQAGAGGALRQAAGAAAQRCAVAGHAVRAGRGAARQGHTGAGRATGVGPRAVARGAGASALDSRRGLGVQGRQILSAGRAPPPPPPPSTARAHTHAHTHTHTHAWWLRPRGRLCRVAAAGGARRQLAGRGRVHGQQERQAGARARRAWRGLPEGAACATCELSRCVAGCRAVPLLLLAAHVCAPCTHHLSARRSGV